jgi:hypothetical protein
LIELPNYPFLREGRLQYRKGVEKEKPYETCWEREIIFWRKGEGGDVKRRGKEIRMKKCQGFLSEGRAYCKCIIYLKNEKFSLQQI